MRINVYVEELLSESDNDGVVAERVETTADTGATFFGARIYLRSPKEIHRGEDDDRSAITFWGPCKEVAALLRKAADEMDRVIVVPRAGPVDNPEWENGSPKLG